MTNMSKAFQPIQFISGATLKNRLMMAPLTIYDSYENGMISDHELSYYKIRANGVGAVITAATYVSFLGKAFTGGPGADSDDKLPGLTRLANTIHSQGSKAILQIFHGGRMVDPSTIQGKQPVSASSVKALRENSVVPRELSNQEIVQIIDDFGNATKRAIKAGFDGVEIHGANTYLIQQFFSPHSNHRSDKWGGSLEKRMNFPLSIIEKVKETVESNTSNPFIIGYRISPEEIEEPGITLDDTLLFIDQIISKKIDYLHVSLGDIFRPSIRNKKDHTPVMEVISDYINNRITIVGVGSIKNQETIDKAIENLADIVSIGRQLIVDPKFVEKLENKDELSIRYNLSYYDKDLLNISDPTWDNISSIPGWFPLSREQVDNGTNEPWL
ncbi:hypothetical protein IGJ83_003444 [Enterococcus pernyi]